MLGGLCLDGVLIVSGVFHSAKPPPPPGFRDYAHWINDDAATRLTASDASSVSTSGQDVKERRFDVTTLGERVVATVDYDGFNCTLGAMAYERTSSAPVYVSAGHCSDVPGVTYRDYTDQGVNVLGVTNVVSTKNGASAYSASSDYSLTRGKPTDQVDVRIGGVYTIVGVADPNDLTTDTVICESGYRTGESCGKALAVNKNFVVAGAFSLHGDSGSPAYIKTGNGTVKLVGFLSGSPTGLSRPDSQDDFVTYFTLAKPIFDEFGLSVL